MRVTNSMLAAQVQRNISQGLSTMQKLQMRMASGKSILEASDDPVGASMAVGLRAAVAAREQFQLNGASARDSLSALEDALNGIQTNLGGVRTTALTGANDSQGADQRSILADQVNQSLEELCDLSKSQYNGDYLFGGTETQSAPYVVTANGARPATLTGFNAVTNPAVALDTAGLPNPVTSGSFTVTIYDAAGTVTATRTVPVTAGVTSLNDLVTALTALPSIGLTATVGADNRLTLVAPAGGSFTLSNDTSGTVAALGLNGFKPGEIGSVSVNPRGISGQRFREIQEGVTLQTNVTGPEVFTQSADLFQTLITLRDALRANNTGAISTSLTTLDTGISQVSTALGAAGSRIQRIDSLKEILANDLTRMKGLLSRVEDDDYASTLLEFQRQQQLFQAALNASAKLIQPSLLDFLS
jgi:flagellar hook-associated protein 3 FlgL